MSNKEDKDDKLNYQEFLDKEKQTLPPKPDKDDDKKPESNK